jgi:hypothetical protein
LKIKNWQIRKLLEINVRNTIQYKGNILIKIKNAAHLTSSIEAEMFHVPTIHVMMPNLKSQTYAINRCLCRQIYTCRYVNASFFLLMLISYESASPCYIPKRSRMGALHVTLVHYIMPLHGTNEHLQSLIHGDQIYLVIYSVSSN